MVVFLTYTGYAASKHLCFSLISPILFHVPLKEREGKIPLGYLGVALKAISISTPLLPFVFLSLPLLSTHFEESTADKQNGEKHGQQADQPAEQGVISEPDQDRSSQYPKARPFHQSRRLPLGKWRLHVLGLLRMRMRGRGCWSVRTGMRQGVGPELLTNQSARGGVAFDA